MHISIPPQSRNFRGSESFLWCPTWSLKAKIHSFTPLPLSLTWFVLAFGMHINGLFNISLYWCSPHNTTATHGVPYAATHKLRKSPECHTTPVSGAPVRFSGWCRRRPARRQPRTYAGTCRRAFLGDLRAVPRLRFQCTFRGVETDRLRGEVTSHSMSLAIQARMWIDRPTALKYTGRMASILWAKLAAALTIKPTI